MGKQLLEAYTRRIFEERLRIFSHWLFQGKRYAGYTQQDLYYYEHIAIEGPHSAPLKHFDKVFYFLEKKFK
jgi:hypothetical protein